MIIDNLGKAMAPYLTWIKVGLVLLALVATFGTGWWVNGLRWEAKENRQLKAAQDQLVAAQEQHLLDKAKWESQSLVDAERITRLDAEKDTLLATLNGLKMTRTITVKPNAQGECESAVLDDAFRLRWNAVVETAAAHAADDRRDEVPGG